MPACKRAAANLRADAVALASGKHNVRGFSRPGGPLVGFKTHVNPSAAARQSMSGIVQLHAFSGGYGGFCLVEDGLLSIAWNIHSDVLRSVGASWAAQSAYLAENSPVFGELIDGAEAAWSKPLAVSGQPYWIFALRAGGGRRSIPSATSLLSSPPSLATARHWRSPRGSLPHAPFSATKARKNFNGVS